MPVQAPDPSGPPQPPPPALLLNEAFAVSELALLPASWPWLSLSPAGDGHPVLVLPGLLTDDGFTAPLRSFLSWRGYAVSGWGHGRNFGHWSLLEEKLLPQLEAMFRDHGRKVSLVGASMGGLYARAMAQRAPSRVRCVVTLSSSIGGPPRSNNVWPLYRMMTGQPAESLQVPTPPVPSTSVYSRIDGLNNWRTCLQDESAAAENVEVFSSHHGMANHPASMYLIADRLAQPESEWRPFERPPWSAAWYPAARQ